MRGVEFDLLLSNLRGVGDCPVVQASEGLSERFTEIGDSVLDTHGRCREDMPLDQAIAFESTQRSTAVSVRDRLRGVERAVRESNGAVTLEIDTTPEIGRMQPAFRMSGGIALRPIVRRTR